MNRHIALAKKCKEFYGDEFLEMKKEARVQSVKTYNVNNVETIRKKQADYNAKNRETKRKKDAEYDTKNRKARNQKQKVYNNLNRMEICEKQRKRSAKTKNAWTKQDRYIAFKNEFKEGLVFECVSCKRALWKSQVEILFEKQINTLANKCGKAFLEEKILMGQKIEDLKHIVFCTTCVRYIRKKEAQIPKIHVSNGLELDEQCEEMDLTELEEQLIAIDLVFMKIKQLPTRRCNAIVDRVINVPLKPENVQKTIESLPRPPDKADVVPIAFKRKEKMKNSHWEAFARPHHCIAALKKLKELGNPFYQNIDINENFMSEPMEIDGNDDHEKESDDLGDPGDLDDNSQTDDQNESEIEDDEDDKLEAVKKYQSKQDSHSCMMPINPEVMVFVNETNAPLEKKLKESSNSSTVVAPGEGSVPDNWLKSENFDVKAHPTKHPTGKFGVHYKRKVKISVQEYFNQRLLNADPRFSECLAYLFMAQQYIERWALQSQINICGRRGVSKQSGEGFEVQVKDMCSIFKSIRGTPKYWQAARNELIAKVKQLGPFQVFFTISCAEMRWSEIFVSILRRKGYKVEFEEDEHGNWNGDDEKISVEGVPLWEFVDSMEESKNDLLKNCTVLLTRHFDGRIRSFIKHILMGNGKDRVPFDYYTYRVEMQARGN